MKFKTIFLLVLCALFAAGDLSAEEMKKRRKKKKKRGKVVAFKAGQIDVGAGGGFLVKQNYSKADYSIYGETETKGGFPFGFRAEYGASEFLGIGLYVGMYKDKITITDVTMPGNVYGYEHKYLNICLRPAFHVPLGMKKLDPYVGVPFGLNKVKATPFNSEGAYNMVQEPLKTGFCWAIHAGANFYFTDNIGAFVEGGYGSGLPMVNFGVVAKF
jgi:hypothetical protein